jgi:hypothetical protein
MGNPSITIQPTADRQGPEIAPPAQPGEQRNCLSCIRCTAVNPSGSYLSVDCTWQGRWDWPHKACDRWAPSPEPIACLLPGHEPKAVVWAGKATSRRRRR